MTPSWLDIANAIGERIVAEAVWHEGQCNWVGALPEPGPYGSVVTTYAALTPDLYGGTSGVALFLAELHGCTGDDDQLQTACGAIRQAVAHRHLVAPEAPGLHAGRLGLAFALSRVGELLNEPAFTAAAATIIDELVPEQSTSFDLLTGAAGAIVGLLALETTFGAHGTHALAEEFGHRLLKTAIRDGDTLSWQDASHGTRRLLGLSHGAAGAAVALLELYAASGEPRWRQAAEQAFAYERRLYEPGVRNWPDLRADPTADDHHGPSFPVFWCHGAPGIALSRLRAVELTGSDQARAEAGIALDTTRADVETAIAAGGNFSACHGIAGNAEILLTGRDVLGEARAADEQTALRAALHGRDSFHLGEREWPCGTYEGVTPSLLLGLAGIGRFYLRLHKPSLPSLLLLRPSPISQPSAPDPEQVHAR